MSPKEIVMKWVEAFNSISIDELAELYHEDAVNHQIPNGPVTGRAGIHQMFCEEFSNADMECIIENIYEDGEWAILEWSDPLGLRGCGFFHVVNDKIVFQRGYWDKLSFCRLHRIPVPDVRY